MSVHIKRVPQVLSGGNFPANDPEDGVHFIFDVPQTSFLSSKTVRNDDDTADVTSANEGDMFKFVANGSKWVRVYENVDNDTQLTSEEVRSIVASFIEGDFGISVLHDDVGNKFRIVAGDQTTLGNYEIETGTMENGDVQFTDSHQTVEIRNIDVNGTNQSTALGNVNVGDMLILERDLDKSHRLYLVVTTTTANTLSYTFTGTLDALSSDTSNFDTVNDSINVYRLVIADTNTTYTISFSGGVLTLTPSSGTAQTVTLPDTNTQRTDEDIRDVVTAQATAGDNITITEDDAGDTLTYAAFAPTLLGRWRRQTSSGATPADGDIHFSNTGSGGTLTAISIFHEDFDGYDRETRLDALAANDEIWIVSSTDTQTIARLIISSVTAAVYTGSARFIYTLHTDSNPITDLTNLEEFFVYHVDAANTAILNTQRTNEEIRDVVAAETVAEIIYGTATTSYTTTDTDTNLIAGRSFSDYRYLLFVFVSTYGNKFYWTEFIAEAIFPNGQSILGLSTSGRAVRLERKNNTTFQLKYVNGSAAFRYIIGIF